MTFLSLACVLATCLPQTATPDSQTPAPHQLGLELFAKGLDFPTFLCSDPADPSRILIAEKAGRIRLFKDGRLRATDFLDLSDQINIRSERGLLGMAFHPNFPTPPWVFLHYSDSKGSTCLSRFPVDLKTWAAEANEETILLQLEQPWANHNGGMIAFSPRDGYLYLGLGDGGAAQDPRDAAQNGHSLLGKILRLDVDHGLPYKIPADNPFRNNPEFFSEIWAFGLRNPWRFCFDPENGDLYIGDVGQDQWEEINWQAGNSLGGENYGWRLREGKHEFLTSKHSHGQPLVEPIHEYKHQHGHCSITGGYVYRGSQIPWLQGAYFYGDYCSGAVGTLRMKNGEMIERIPRRKELAKSANLSGLVSFGVDAAQELYILCADGRVYRLVEATK